MPNDNDDRLTTNVGTQPLGNPSSAEPRLGPKRPDASQTPPGLAKPPGLAGEVGARDENQDGQQDDPRDAFVPAVSLPTSGGSLRSIGEKFEANSFTGSGGMTVPIATTPGRGGFGPQLGLSYGSGSGNGPFGVGWSLSVPAITRKTDKGLPLYEDGRESDVFLLSGAEDLVPVVDEDTEYGLDWGEDWGQGGGEGEKFTEVQSGVRVHRYRPRVEGAFARIERLTNQSTGEVHWRATTPDNVVSVYGETAQARISDPDRPGHVFSWLLERTEDDRGNIVEYVYKQEDLDGVDANSLPEQNRLAAQAAQAQRYLKRIKYGNKAPSVASDYAFEVVFDYGEHGTWQAGPELEISPTEDVTWPQRQDVFSSFRSGFELRTRRLCQRVLMFHHFEELTDGLPGEVDPYLVASTDFIYDEDPALTRLVGVRQRGYVRNDVTTYYAPSDIPDLEFTYSVPTIDTTLAEVDADSLENLPMGIDGDAFRLVDLDGEGVPGVLTEQAGHWYYKRGLGDGSFGPMVALPSAPSGLDFGSGAQLMDLDGDGCKELVAFGPPTPGFFTRSEEEGWDGFRRFTQVPNIDWRDPNLQLIDLSGDGFADVLIARDTHYVWYRSLGKDGFDHPRRVARPKDERAGPPMVVSVDARQSIQLADMTGDGLADIVRVRNGEIAYWPALGHGRFGRKVTMSGVPHFDTPDQFRPDRVRLADVDGTGTQDVIYLGRNDATLWMSQAGNGLGAKIPLWIFPGADDTDFVQVVDMKGTGTACLLWSTRRKDGRPGTIRYLDLMGGQKPHLLIGSKNNMGAETLVHYTTSTKFYLADRLAGKPWATKLPFPVHVVERVEHYDHVAKTKFVNHYAYHHGHFDGTEREFRGFAMVEQWDTESFEDFGGTGLLTFEVGNVTQEDLHQPPVHTKTWFHTGAWFGRGRISKQHQSEYWAGDASHELLPDTVLPPGLNGYEAREACRALRGRTLRSEVYALDGDANEDTPYQVAEANFTVRMLQGRVGPLRHAVFFVHEREALTYDYERNAADPRIGHAATLEVDVFGNPIKTVSVGYPRRASQSPKTEQALRHLVYSESDLASQDDATAYRAGVPVESRSYEVLVPTAEVPLTTVPIDFDTLTELCADAGAIAYDDVPDPLLLRKRLLTRTQQTYWADNLSGELALGQVGTRALPYRSKVAAFRPQQLDAVFGAKEDLATLETILEDEGEYEKADGLWWIVSGHTKPDAALFYLPIEGHDPFGNTPHLTTWDSYGLLVEEVRDPLLRDTTVTNDYRVMQPVEITDINGNRTEVEVDGLGVVVKTAVKGKSGAGEGDTLSDPTTKLEYDLFKWQNDDEPNYIHTFARKEHGGTADWLESYQYFAGSGQVVMTKVQAAPGMAPLRDGNGDLDLDGQGEVQYADTSPDPRWIGNGRTVFDNKGNPVKQYEPYFSSIPDFEDETELVEQGVTPVLHYDPLGRLVRTDFPDATFSKVEFDGWMQKTFDANDTAKDTTWYSDRTALPAGDPDREAAESTDPHYDTPTTVHLDALGRTYLAVQHNGFDGQQAAIEYETKTVFDVQGNVLDVINALGHSAQDSVYGMAGQVLKTYAKETGARWALADVVGNPLRTWNERDFTGRFEYDQMLRPTHHWVHDGVSEILVTFTVYGDDVTDGDDENLYGRVYRVYDSAGAATNVEYDFKGNLLEANRVLGKLADVDATLDWSALDGQANLAAVETAAASDLESETFTTTSTHDALNRVVTATSPDSSVQTFGFDEGGALVTVDVEVKGGTSASYVQTIEYDAKGRREKIEYSGGDVKTTYTYDAVSQRLKRILTTRTGANKLQDLNYFYDAVGNITEIQDDALQTVYYDNAVVDPHQTFTYDPLYRLTEATGRQDAARTDRPPGDETDVPQLVPFANGPTAMETYTQQYEYDAVGNILKMDEVGGWTLEYDYDTLATGNRLLATNTAADLPGQYSDVLGHDVHGNVTSMPHLSAIEWDWADRMQRAQLDVSGDESVFFVYDAAGRRVRKVRYDSVSGVRKERIYLGAFELYRRTVSLAQKEETETLHVSDDTGRICMVETKTKDSSGNAINPTTSYDRFQLGNHLGTAAVEVDGSGNVISYEEYYAYGASSYRAKDSTVDVSSKRYRYTGMERDEETGLALHGARYYACWLGRWMSGDPIGIAGGIDVYEYSAGNPVGLSDTGGMAPMTPAEARAQIVATVATVNAHLALGNARAKNRRNGVREKLANAGRLLDDPRAQLQHAIGSIKGEFTSRVEEGQALADSLTTVARLATTDLRAMAAGLSDGPTSAVQVQQQGNAETIQIITGAVDRGALGLAMDASGVTGVQEAAVQWVEAVTGGDYVAAGEAQTKGRRSAEQVEMAVGAAGLGALGGVARLGNVARTLGRGGRFSNIKVRITQAEIDDIFSPRSTPAAGGGGVVSGRSEILAKARLAQKGTSAKSLQAAAEIRAAKHLQAQGKNVHFQTPGATRSGQGGTADFLVGGEAGTGAGGTPFDVLAPTSGNPNAVFRALRNKNNQAQGVILDLSNTSVEASQLGDIMARLRGAGATNIRQVIILP